MTTTPEERRHTIGIAINLQANGLQFHEERGYEQREPDPFLRYLTMAANPFLEPLPNPLTDRSPWTIETERIQRRMESTVDFLRRHGIVDHDLKIEWRRDTTYPPTEVLEYRAGDSYPAVVNDQQARIERLLMGIPIPDGPTWVIGKDFTVLGRGGWNDGSWSVSNVGQGGTGEYWRPRRGMSGQMLLLLLSLIALGAIAAWIILAAGR